MSTRRLAYLASVATLLVSCTNPTSFAPTPTPKTPSAFFAAEAVIAAPSDQPGLEVANLAASAPLPALAPTATPMTAPLPEAAETPRPVVATRGANSSVTPSLVKVIATRSIRGVAPRFTDVAERAIPDVLAYLQGNLAGYPNGDPSSIFDFSPADILETMDTAVLDQIRRKDGDTALHRVYDLIASAVLTTIREEYPGQTVVIALDAGHGGKTGYYWDPGSEGTEALHTRAVARSIVQLARQPEFVGVVIRLIYNDGVADDLGVPAPRNRPTINQLLVRQVRAAMLADEVSAWNRDRPDAPVAMHEISVHFNSGAGGALVLHEGDSVRPEFRDRSVDFGEKYLERVIAALNASGLLPTPLRRWGGSGLHDDVMLYRPAYLNGLSLPPGFVPRYGMLQGGSYMRRYVSLVLGHPSGSTQPRG